MRLKNVLISGNINTVADILEFEPLHLLRIRNCGKSSISELMYFFKENNIYEIWKEKVGHSFNRIYFNKNNYLNR